MNVLLNSKDCGWVHLGMLSIAACIAITLGSTTSNAATVVANFDDGAGTGVDGYLGAATPGVAPEPGAGWQNPWVLKAGSNSVTDTVPAGGSPIVGGGNYLDVDVQSTNSGAGTFSVQRKFQDPGAISSPMPYEIKFTYRIDEDVDSVTSTFTDFQDRYMIAEAQGGLQVIGDGGASNNFSWSIWGFGGSDDLGASTSGNLASGVAKHWAFYNGDSAGGSFDPSSASMINTGIEMTTGGVYDFIITVDPVTSTWDATVNDGTNSFSQTGMGFKNSGAVQSTLHFLTKRSRLDSTLFGDTRAFSIDGVSVSSVPEPSSLMIAFCGCLALGMSLRRKHLK